MVSGVLLFGTNVAVDKGNIGLNSEILKGNYSIMLEKIYLGILGLYAVTFTTVFLAGLMTAGVAVVFGFVLFGLLYMGIIGVLPEYAVHHVESHR